MERKIARLGALMIAAGLAGCGEEPHPETDPCQAGAEICAGWDRECLGSPEGFRCGNCLAVASGTCVDLTVSANLSHASLLPQRACGDAVAYQVLSLTSNRGILAEVPMAGCLETGDEVVLINAQGMRSKIANVGRYEELTVASVEGPEVIFETDKVDFYGESSSGDEGIGSALGEQRVLLQRVAHYSTLSISTGTTLTVDPWDGERGGMLFLKVDGLLLVDGVIELDGAGFEGGDWPRIPQYGFYTGFQGSSIDGIGVESSEPHAGAGGGGEAGAECYTGSTYEGSRLCGGPGGGGYSASGGAGEPGMHDGTCGSSDNGAQGGSAYGQDFPGRLYLGSGGGGGGSGPWPGMVGGHGGAGGGLLYLDVGALELAGTLSSKGADGTLGISSIPFKSRGAGGSGGSVLVISKRALAPDIAAHVDVRGGRSENDDWSSGAGGGTGSSGRVSLSAP
jgi:hypothetical protein